MSLLVARFRDLSAATWAAVRRFPLALVAGAVGAVAGCLLVDDDGPQPSRVLPLTWLLTSWLGVSLSLVAALVGERLGGPSRRLSLQALVVLVLAACFAGLHGARQEWLFIRFALWILAAHGLLALAPLVARAGGDFRAFNLMLFARTLSALLFTHVLFAGLCFALLAVKQLFDAPIADRVFPRLWFVLLGVFNTAYVLAGVPRDWDRLEGRFSTPPVLDALARHVLLPLSGVYLVILYSYSLKIVVVREWPRGWVSAPVIAFAAVGMLTVLLLGPERQAGSRLVRAYGRGFFYALLPLVLLLGFAVYRRTSEYGLTEERCLLYAIVAFLAIVGVYFVVARAPKLAVIPAVLAAVAVVASIGPLSARAWSIRSQTARLRGVLEAAGRLDGGGLVRADRAVPRAHETELSGLLLFLEERGALGRVLSWRAPDEARCPACARWKAAPSAGEVMEALGLTYRPHGKGSATHARVRYQAADAGPLRVTGFDWVLPGVPCTRPGAACEVSRGAAAPGAWAVHLDRSHLYVSHAGRALGEIPLAELLARVASAAGAPSEVPAEALTVAGAWPGGRYRLHVSVVEVDRTGAEGGPRVTEMRSTLLVGLGTTPER